MRSLKIKIVQKIANIFRIRQYYLRRIPGWTFSFAEKNLNILARIRLKLWKISLAKQIKIKVRIKWINNIKLEIELGHDVSRLIYVGGLIEPNELLAAKRIIRSGMTVIDVGANEGYYSLFFASLVGPRGKVLSVEPSLRELVALRRNILLNSDLSVIVEDQACSDHEGDAFLLVADEEHRGQNTLGKFAYECTGLLKRELVKTITLDCLVEKYQLKTVHFIKIDVEGAEAKVLEGAKCTLAACRPVLLIELLEPALHHQGASGRAITRVLRRFDYEILVLGDKDGLWTHWNEESPIAISENILAVPSQGKQEYLQLLNQT